MIKDDNFYNEFHIQALPVPEDTLRPQSTSGLPVNVAMIMFDSQSAANFVRHMPKTMKILEKSEDAFIFKGHSIVADGTTGQLCVMWTGMPEEDLPEARRGRAKAKSVDNWPFIYKDFHNHGYTSLYSEDDPAAGAFNFRLWGWEVKPTHHYARPFWIEAHKFANRYSCVLSQYCHEISFQYLIDFYKINHGNRKLSFNIMSLLSHDNFNHIQLADDDLQKLILQSRGDGVLNNTILIIFGDHGPRSSEWRSTIQGKLEERLPFFSIVLPTWIREKHPEIIQGLRENTGALTSHYDVYATLRHILSYPSMPKNISVGQSLFTKIFKKNRTCESAGVEDHWCPCLQFEEQNVSDSSVIMAAKQVVSYINNQTNSIQKARKLCAKLQLKNILRAGKRIPNKKVQQFARTSGKGYCDSCGVVLDKSLPKKFKNFVYELSFSVLPSNGTYEATAYVNGNIIRVDPNISRTNRYGDEPSCIQNEYPFLRKYCYCR